LLACLASFLVWFLQVLRRWGVLPNLPLPCMTYNWSSRQGGDHWWWAQYHSLPRKLCYTNLWFVTSFALMEWNGMDQMMEFISVVTYPNWGWNEKSGCKQYTGNKTGEQSSFLTEISPQMSFTPSFGFCLIWLLVARPLSLNQKACQHFILQIFWTDTQFLEMDLLILWRHSNWGWNRD
jgi:hypothetical protein